MSTAPLTSAPECTRTPGDSTERRTLPPDTMTPGLTSDSIAWPTRPGESCTNLAGGCEPTLVRIGQCRL